MRSLPSPDRRAGRLRRAWGPRARVLCAIPPVVLWIASPGAGQTGGWPAGSPSAGPGWLPQMVALNETTPFTAAEKARVKAVLDGIEAVLRRVPVLARPEGFQLEPVFAGRGDLVPRRDRLYTYQYRLLVWAGEKKRYDDPITRVIVTVNPYPEYLLEVPGRGPFARYGDDEFEDVIYYAPHRTGTLPGSGFLYDRLDYPWASFVQGVYVAGDVAPFLPVSRERVLRAELARQGEGDSIMAAASPNLPGLAAVPSPSVGIRQQLATMSPAELAEQACLDLTNMWRNEGVEGGLKLAFVPPSPGADCLVHGNPAFYASGDDPVAPRIIDVWLQVDGPGGPAEELRDPTVVKVFETLDWAALGALVESPPE